MWNAFFAVWAIVSSNLLCLHTPCCPFPRTRSKRWNCTFDNVTPWRSRYETELVTRRFLGWYYRLEHCLSNALNWFRKNPPKQTVYHLFKNKEMEGLLRKHFQTYVKKIIYMPSHHDMDGCNLMKYDDIHLLKNYFSTITTFLLAWMVVGYSALDMMLITLHDMHDLQWKKCSI